MKYDLKKYCKNCPFRNDKNNGWLGEERAKEIAQSILDGDKMFPCHKTTNMGDDRNIEEESVCYGSLQLIQAEKGLLSNFSYRLAKMLGWTNKNEIKEYKELFKNRNNFIKHHKH